MSNLHPDIIHKINQSEIEGGIFLEKLPEGKALEVQTKNTLYIIRRNGHEWTIQGNRKYCPEPTFCKIAGSTWGGSMLKMGFVGRGMHLEFYIEGHRPITTSTIQEITEVSK